MATSPASSDASLPRPLRIFLCHASGDKQAVRALSRKLGEDGFQPWLDEEDLLPGQDWQREIPNAVRASHVVIVCLSQHSITKAGYVQKEIRYALDVADEQPESQIFLIPVRLETCEVPERLRRWQWVDLYDPRGYERLRRALNLRLNAPPPFPPVNSTDGAKRVGAPSSAAAVDALPSPRRVDTTEDWDAYRESGKYGPGGYSGEIVFNDGTRARFHWLSCPVGLSAGSPIHAATAPFSARLEITRPKRELRFSALRRIDFLEFSTDEAQLIRDNHLLYRPRKAWVTFRGGETETLFLYSNSQSEYWLYRSVRDQGSLADAKSVVFDELES